MEAHGVRHPIHISKLSNTICFGHGRLEAAKLNGYKEYPIVYQAFENDEEEYACVQSDNAIAHWAELDLAGINADIGQLGPDFDLDLLGIKDFELEPADKYAGCDEDEVPEYAEPNVKTGDIYQLGAHRLMCGDSTKAEEVESLMDGQTAIVFVTDPPYGVSYAGKNEYLNMIAPGNRIQTPIEGDSGTIEESGAIWFSAYKNAIAQSDDRASFYIFSPQGGDLMMMMMMIDKAGWTLKHMLVWVKNNHVLGRCDYHYKHEPIFYGWNKRHDFYGGSSCFSVLEFPKPLKNDLHPTMKPVELLEKLISNSSLKGANVLDLFGGSGSTLIACEKTNRKCFMMELDQHYCDIIIARWEKYTGKKAELISGAT
jgi:site-specific DNA-methyltransferase (adenine-specific)